MNGDFISHTGLYPFYEYVDDKVQTTSNVISNRITHTSNLLSSDIKETSNLLSSDIQLIKDEISDL